MNKHLHCGVVDYHLHIVSTKPAGLYRWGQFGPAAKLIVGSECVLMLAQIEPGSSVEHVEHITVLSSCLIFNTVPGSSHKSQQPLNKNGVYLLCADYEETAVYVVFPISGWINYAIRRVKMNSFNKGDCPRSASELIFSSSRA